ncbi:MAG: DUF2088 domain-containing protein [Planctomycetes bacterium]|nr:DUF2088 domain-containing protein [Planctomycetota bacterium]
MEWSSLGPKPALQSRPAGEVLDEALAATPAMREFLGAAGRDRAAIVLAVNDGDRSTRTFDALRAVGRLVRSLAEPPRFRALVATGTHSYSATERASFEAATFGHSGLAVDDITWHQCDATADLVAVGPVRFHRLIAQSRHLLPIGSVEPHYFAGLTGPHKTVTIGCLSRADIERNHAAALSPDSDILRLAGNPVHEGIVSLLHELQAAQKQVRAIGEVVVGSALTAAATGDPLRVVERLVPVVRGTYVHVLDHPVDVLHLKVPWPLGRSLYQADKALKNNHVAVRDGGGIVLDAACPDGVGPDAFLSLLRRAPDYASANALVQQQGYRLGDHKAVKLRHLTDPAQRGVRVALVSARVSAADAAAAGMYACADLGAALAWLERSHVVPLRQGLVVEDAGFVTVTARRDACMPGR